MGYIIGELPTKVSQWRVQAQSQQVQSSQVCQFSSVQFSPSAHLSQELYEFLISHSRMLCVPQLILALALCALLSPPETLGKLTEYATRAEAPLTTVIFSFPSPQPMAIAMAVAMAATASACARLAGRRMCFQRVASPHRF